MKWSMPMFFYSWRSVVMRTWIHWYFHVTIEALAHSSAGAEREQSSHMERMERHLVSRWVCTELLKQAPGHVSKVGVKWCGWKTAVFAHLVIWDTVFYRISNPAIAAIFGQNWLAAQLILIVTSGYVIQVEIEPLKPTSAILFHLPTQNSSANSSRKPHLGHPERCGSCSRLGLSCPLLHHAWSQWQGKDICLSCKTSLCNMRGHLTCSFLLDKSWCRRG